MLCGIDEAGRGPLAGPVTAAAVILPSSFDVSILKDSKKLTEKKEKKCVKPYMPIQMFFGLSAGHPITK